MLYRTHVMPMIMVELGNINNRIISQIAAERWNAESEPVKIWYRLMAKMGKEEHAINHPGYKYAPNKKLLDYPAQVSYRGGDEADEPDQAGGMVERNEPKDVISDDDDDYEDPTYGRRKPSKKYAGARRRELGRKQQRGLRPSNSFTRQQSARGRHKITEGKDSENRGPGQVFEDSGLGLNQSAIDVTTFLGPQAITGLGGGMHNDVHYHVSCGHGSTSLTGSFIPTADHQLLVESQRLYPLQTQCCRVFQQHAFQQLEPQPFQLLENYRHFPTLTGEERELYPQHQQQYHESRQDWTPPFYLPSSSRHSFYDIDPEANASVETLVDPNNHWLVHRYYDPGMVKDLPVYHDSKLRTEKDLPPLPMEINLDAVHDPHAVLAQLSSTIYRVGQDGDESKVAMTPGSLYTGVRQEDRLIKADTDKAPPQAGGTNSQRFLISPAGPTYMSFTEAGQM